MSKTTAYRHRCFTAGLALLLVGALVGPWCNPFGLELGIPLCMGRKTQWAVGALLIIASLVGAKSLPRISPPLLAVALLLFMLGDSTLRPHTYFFKRSIWIEIAAGAAIFALLHRLFPRRGPIAAVAAAGAAGLAAFFTITAGALIFSDDHASFFYRLTQLTEQFPRIPFYNPMWNAGVEAREFFPSGVLNLFLLWSLPLAIAGVEPLYNLMVITVPVVIAPCSAYAGARLLGCDRDEAALAALAAFAPSIFWHRWIFSYGTMGFALSVALIPLVAALAIRGAERDSDLTRIQGAVLVTAGTLTALWSPAAVALLPLAAYWLFRIRSVLKKPVARICLCLLLLINLPWMAIFVSASRVDAVVFDAGHGAPATPTDSEASSGHQLRAGAEGNKVQLGAVIAAEQSAAMNPALLFLGLPGLFFFARGERRLLFGALTGWLIVLGTLLSPYAPRLELDRMLIIAALLLTAPAAQNAMRAVRNAAGRTELLLGHISAGFLLVSPWTLLLVLAGRTEERIIPAEPIVEELSAAIRQHGGPGRVMIAGFILHELSQGHVAPLPYFTSHPMMASRYQHDRWDYIDIVPEPFRREGAAGIERFLDIYNVGAIVTHDKFWRQWYGKQRGKYRLAWRGGRFSLFTRVSFTPSYFIEGEGSQLQQDGAGLTVTLNQPDAVLKFHYLPFLEAGICRIEPADRGTGEPFIALRGCPVGIPIRIQSIPPLRRFFGIG